MMLFSVVAFVVLAGTLLYHKFSGPLSGGAIAGAVAVALAIWGLGFGVGALTGEREVEHLTLPDQALGFVLAKQLREDGVPSGTVAVRNPVPRGDTWKKRVKSRVAGIEAALAGGGYTLDASGKSTPTLTSGSLEESGGEIGGIEEDVGDAVATISFLGPPRSYVKTKHPYYVLVRGEHDPTQWHAALKRGYLSGVVMAKMRRDWGSYKGDDLQQVFDNRYRLLLPKGLPPLKSLLPGLPQP